MHLRYAYLFVSFLTLEVGCAHKPAEPPVKPYVHRIAVVPATDPLNLTLESRTAVMFASPLVAQLMAFDTKGKEQRLNKSPVARDLGLASRLTAPVVAALRQAGYDVDVLEDLKRPADDPDDVDLDVLGAGAEMILRLRIPTAGFYSAMGSNDYVPHLSVDAKLLVRSTDDDLYDETLHYGADPRPAPVRNRGPSIAPDARHSYGSFDDLMARSDEIKPALQLGTDALAALLAQQLVQRLATGTRPSP